jgi:hypothetical protein
MFLCFKGDQHSWRWPLSSLFCYPASPRVGCMFRRLLSRVVTFLGLSIDTEVSSCSPLRDMSTIISLKKPTARVAITLSVKLIDVGDNLSVSATLRGT